MDKDKDITITAPAGRRQHRRRRVPHMTDTTTKWMNYRFGIERMTDCIEVTERLTIKADGWEMTRTFTYADGASKSFVDDNANYYCLVPASDGWIAETDSYDHDPVRARHPIAVWRYVIDGQESHLFPEFPGDRSMTRSVAVISPDGRIYEVSDRGCLVNFPFQSPEAWHAHVTQKRAEYLAEKERERLEEEKAALERRRVEASIVFQDGSSLLDVRRRMAEEGFDVVPNRADRMNALANVDEIPF
jgi:hypothetical protein